MGVRGRLSGGTPNNVRNLEQGWKWTPGPQAPGSIKAIMENRTYPSSSNIENRHS